MNNRKGFILTMLLIALLGLYGCGKKNTSLKDVYNTALNGQESSWYISLADDESYISIDTNPFDIDDYYSDEAVSLIKSINKDLGLTDSVWEEMSQVRALDGRKSIIENKIEVTYSYHPNKGLSVVYKIAK